MQTTPHGAERLIDFSELKYLTSLGTTKLYELMAAGEFLPIKLGTKNLFSEPEIYDWIRKHLASRPAAGAKHSQQSTAVEDRSQHYKKIRAGACKRRKLRAQEIASNRAANNAAGEAL